MMNPSDVAKSRLVNQQLATAKFKTVEAVVGWMGALQAQDFNMAKWAIGVRLPGATERTVQAALDRGEILRTHVLRPTWHFVAAADIHWLLELTAPRIRASLRSRYKELGLTREIFAKSNSLIEKALADGDHLSRKEMTAVLERGKMGLADRQAFYHLLLGAELDGLICSGAVKGKEPAYALLAARAPKKKTMGRDEALAELARRYFTSHGPATVLDFAWWSGLPAADAKKSLAMAGPDLASETIGAQAVWFARAFSPSRRSGKENVRLLPAYDELIISYRDRSAAIARGVHRKAISANGLFRPVIALDGQAIGTWERAEKKAGTVIGARFFGPADKNTMDLLAKEALRYGRFCGFPRERVLTVNAADASAIDSGPPKR